MSHCSVHDLGSFQFGLQWVEYLKTESRWSRALGQLKVSPMVRRIFLNRMVTVEWLRKKMSWTVF